MNTEKKTPYCIHSPPSLGRTFCTSLFLKTGSQDGDAHRANLTYCGQDFNTWTRLWEHHVMPFSLKGRKERPKILFELSTFIQPSMLTGKHKNDYFITLTSIKLLKKVSSSSSKGINVWTYDTISHLQQWMNISNTKFHSITRSTVSRISWAVTMENVHKEDVINKMFGKTGLT